MSRVVKIEAANELLGALVGMRISEAWKGIGTAVFLDIEPLRSTGGEEVDAPSIQTHFGSWRVESPSEVVVGSSDSLPDIDDGIGTLTGERIEAIWLDGRLPELVVRFFNGLTLRTLTTNGGDPEWKVRLSVEGYLMCEEGELLLRGPDESRGFTEEEREADDRSQVIADRWGTPRSDPVGGQCSDCAHFVWLDGDFCLGVPLFLSHWVS
jgi:hypothetical protein